MLSTILHTLTAFVASHPGAVAWLLATLLAIYRTRTPAQWIALGERLPRVQGLIRLARGAGLDPARVIEGVEQVLTGRRIPDPRELVIASQAAELTELRAALAALQRRVSDSHEVTAPSFDPSRRQTIVPEVAAEVQRAIGSATPAQVFSPEFRDPGNGQRGSASLRVLLGVVVGLAVVLPLGVGLYGCPASRQLTRPALGQVDGCEPRSTRCAPDGRPQVCSGSRRWTDADNACALGVNVSAVCCLTRSPVTGAELHACVIAERCLPVDGGTR